MTAMGLQAKVAIVTGATRGIGRAITERFLHEGAQVMAAARDPRRGAQVVADLGGREAGIAFTGCDVSRKPEVEHLVCRTVEEFGRLDIVVNNAGLNHAASFLATTEEDWDRVIGVDLKGTFLLSQAAARTLVRQGQGGSIINLSSVMAVLALGDQVPYCAAKGGVTQLTKSMAIALGRHGIRVNCIGPGPIRTELMEVVVHNEAKKRELLERLPLGRVGTCEEVAAVAAFLASDDASFITGQAIYPDGGRMIQGFPPRLEELP